MVLRQRLYSIPIVTIALLVLIIYYALVISFTQSQSHSAMELEDADMFQRNPREATDWAQETPFNATNETFHSQFPHDVFTLEQKRMGAILLHVLGIIYMFAGLALVCDEFFVPSLEVIVEIFKIPRDVAGATFMAAGGSAPEFFTSLFGIFFAQNSIGFGTIVGSAVFNILFVIGLCGLFAKQALLLTWWPLFRDTSFYTVALALLIGFFRGGEIEWYESLALFLLYICYVLFMFINGKAERLARKLISKIKDCLRCKKLRVQQATPSQEVDIVADSQDLRISLKPYRKLEPLTIASQLQLTDSTPTNNLSVSHKFLQLDRGISKDSSTGTINLDTPSSDTTQTISVASSSVHITPAVFFTQSLSTEAESVKAPLPSDNHCKSSSDHNSISSSSLESSTSTSNQVTNTPTPVIQVEQANVDEGDEPAAASEGEDDEEGIVNIIPPKGWCKIIQWIIFLPIVVVLFFTLPNVRKPRWHWTFPWVFIGSIAWIGVFSYFMVWWATEFGETAMIPPSVMGMTILAAGTSIPDLITSVIVARKGFGDMAVSSSIGSNMFDITVGLPVPWLIYSAVNAGTHIDVFSMGLFCSVILLVGMLLISVSSIAIFRWKLGKLLGLFYLVLYALFVTLGILLELVLVCTIS